MSEFKIGDRVLIKAIRHNGRSHTELFDTEDSNYDTGKEGIVIARPHVHSTNNEYGVKGQSGNPWAIHENDICLIERMVKRKVRKLTI